MQCRVINPHYSRLKAFEATYVRKCMQAKTNTDNFCAVALLLGIFFLLLTVGGCKQKGGPPQSTPEVRRPVHADSVLP